MVLLQFRFGLISDLKTNFKVFNQNKFDTTGVSSSIVVFVTAS